MNDFYRIKYTNPYVVYYYTYEDLVRAYLSCRTRKRNKDSAIEFELHFEDNLRHLVNQINTCTYIPDRYSVFTISDPKPREIWAASFKDRIVHHLIYNSLMPYYVPRFIEDTFSCIPNRGTLAGGIRAYEFMRKCSQNFVNPTYYGKIDLKNFFNSINKNILWNIIYDDIGYYINGTVTEKLIYQNIFTNPTINPIIKPNADFSIIPRHKSLFNNPSWIGLPIGNITSQFYSNIYLNRLDKFCKHVLKIKYYVRYVDDILIFDNDIEKIKNNIYQINNYLQMNLQLQLHENKIFINKIDNGFTFIGFTMRPYVFQASHRAIHHLYNKIYFFNQYPDQFKGSIQSYLGLMKHGQNYNTRKDVCEKIKDNANYNKDYSIIKLKNNKN